MSDPEVATKAPESDATESLMASSGPAQTGPTMGEHCTTDRPTPSGEAPSGELSKLGDVDVYVSKPADYPHAPSKVLLFLTGGTGLHSTNNQLQADKFATEGFLVVMPDMFANDPAPNSSSAVVEDTRTSSIIEEFKMRAAETAKSFLIDMWLARHTQEKVLPILHRVIEGIKDEFADAVSSGGGIYGVGYCFGAKYIILLAGEHSHAATHSDEEAVSSSNGPYIKAGALAHGTMVTREDFQGLKAPLTFVCVENDQLFPDDVREAGEKYVIDNALDADFKVYPGVPHGFAVVGEYTDSHIKNAQAEAFNQMLAWLQSH